MKPFTKIFIILLAISNLTYANPAPNLGPDFNKINIQNTILAKIEDKVITTLDVQKKLDIAYKRAFPDLQDSVSSRFQFYQSGWSQILNEMIKNELVLQEATKLNYSITESELSEEMETRFGPNIMLNLQKMSLTYDEALEMTKEEMIIQRLLYYFVRARAEQNVTPSMIRHAYRLHLKANPDKTIYKYHVVSVRSDDNTIAKNAATKVAELLKDKTESPKDLENEIKAIEKEFDKCTVNISNLFDVSDKDLAIAQKQVLEKLQKNSYSTLTSQKSRINNKEINRIFYLKDLETVEARTFDEMSQDLKQKLLESEYVKESDKFFEKLKNQYHVENYYSNKNMQDVALFTME